MPRTIILKLDTSRLEHVNTLELYQALGYLSTWSLSSYDVLSIYHDHNKEDLIAHYQHSGSGKTYVIGAIWDSKTKTYSFHS